MSNNSQGLLVLERQEARLSLVESRLHMISSGDQRVKLAEGLRTDSFRLISAKFANALYNDRKVPSANNLIALREIASEFSISVEKTNFRGAAFFHRYLWEDNGRLLADLYKFARDLYQQIDTDNTDINLVDVPDQTQSPIFAKISSNIITLDEGNALSTLIGTKPIDEARKYLKSELSSICTILADTNADPRFVSTFSRLSELINFDDDAGSIQFGLHLKLVAALVTRLENELNDIAFVRLSSFLLNASHFVSQYKDWVEFAQNAANFARINDIDAYIDNESENVSRVLEEETGVVDPRIPHTFRLVKDALFSGAEARKQATYGIVKGFENICIVAMRFSYDLVLDILKTGGRAAKPATTVLVALGMIAVTLKLVYAFTGVVGASAELAWIIENLPQILKMQHILEKIK